MSRPIGLVIIFTTSIILQSCQSWNIWICQTTPSLILTGGTISDKSFCFQTKILIFFSRTAFDKLSSLRQLSLSHNHLKKLEKELFEPLTLLDSLTLDNNYLEDINEVFLGLGNLKHLSLTHNSVKWFDIAFFPKSVQTINLAKNMIEARLQMYLSRKIFRW